MTQKHTRRGFTQKTKNAVICPPCGESVAQATKEGQNWKKTLWPLLPRLTAVLPPQGREMFRGFTLIELLVVVLIIGILAALAVPQYQKAVIKSQNAEMKQIVKAVAQAEQAYYLTNGQYAANFNELDIGFPLTPIATTSGKGAGECSTTVYGTDSVRQGKNYYVAINPKNATLQSIAVVAYWRTGTYKCAGFGMNPALDRGVVCRESKKEKYYKAAEGAFCEKVEQSVMYNSDDNWRYYRLP